MVFPDKVGLVQKNMLKPLCISKRLNNRLSLFVDSLLTPSTNGGKDFFSIIVGSLPGSNKSLFLGDQGCPEGSD